MTHESIVMGLMDSLLIADKHTVGELMAKKGYWKPGVSTVNNSYKAMMTLSEEGRLVKGDGYFKVPWCKSEFKEHSQLLTKTLAEILKHYEAVIYREKSIQEVALRPDALVLLIKENKGRCLVLEVCNNETQQYLTKKINTWEQWEHSTEFLSELFGYRIPHFEFLVVGAVHPKALTIEEVIKWN